MHIGFIVDPKKLKLFFSKIMFSDDTFTLKTMWLFGETDTTNFVV